jgi:hypothetical protein
MPTSVLARSSATHNSGVGDDLRAKPAAYVVAVNRLWNHAGGCVTRAQPQVGGGTRVGLRSSTEGDRHRARIVACARGFTVPASSDAALDAQAQRRPRLAPSCHQLVVMASGVLPPTRSAAAAHGTACTAPWQHPWQHPDRPMRPYRPRGGTIRTIWRDADGYDTRVTRLRAWSGITGWRFESSSAHLWKAPLGGAFSFDAASLHVGPNFSGNALWQMGSAMGPHGTPADWRSRGRAARQATTQVRRALATARSQAHDVCRRGPVAMTAITIAGNRSTCAGCPARGSRCGRAAHPVRAALIAAFAAASAGKDAA